MSWLVLNVIQNLKYNIEKMNGNPNYRFTEQVKRLGGGLINLVDITIATGNSLKLGLVPQSNSISPGSVSCFLH
jgi:hypothetical protein